MALSKTESSNYGVDATYWNVSETNIFWKTMRCEIIMAGYVDEATRRAGKDYIISKSLNIDFSIFAALPITSALDIVSAVYGLVKYMVPDFSDAVDLVSEGQKKFDVRPYLPKAKETQPIIHNQDPNFVPNYPAVEPPLIEDPPVEEDTPPA